MDKSFSSTAEQKALLSAFSCISRDRNSRHLWTASHRAFHPRSGQKCFCVQVVSTSPCLVLLGISQPFPYSSYCMLLYFSLQTQLGSSHFAYLCILFDSPVLIKFGSVIKDYKSSLVLGSLPSFALEARRETISPFLAVINTT